MFDFLKKIPLFSGLEPEDLQRLCEMISERHLTAGETLFEEGDLGDQAYIIKQGEIEIFKHSNNRRLLIAVRRAGEIIGEMSLIEATPRNASGKARTDSALLVISHEQLNDLISTNPSAARSMLNTFSYRLKTMDLLLHENEKMARLGTLTAGIVHELNNPASAVMRGSSQLEEALEKLQQAQTQLECIQLNLAQREQMQSLGQLAREKSKTPGYLDPLTRSDEQEKVEAWLAQHQVQLSWELAPELAEVNLTAALLDEMTSAFVAEGHNGGTGALSAVLRWLGASISVYRLLEEISQGSGRMVGIVRALKTYSYLDQAPVQMVDVHEGLDNTLIMLRSLLQEGVSVRREYDPDLPRIQAYGSELNQVWTNLIMNAVDAMHRKGEILLRTRLRQRWVVVEVADTGPGIPPEIRDKIFSPFFTTKPVGEGTGLGLSISESIIRKHGGEIKLFSRPGKTRFVIYLPVELPEGEEEQAPFEAVEISGDDKLRRILESTRTIAVVGASNSLEAPRYTVPAYLKSKGYRIYAVNPGLDEFLGEPAYPSLLALPEPVDVVLIFRRSEDVPPVVEDAIQADAKTIWMQEGIIHQEAAAAAEEAGLDVVMDTCMRSTYKRLMGEHQEKSNQEEV